MTREEDLRTMAESLSYLSKDIQLARPAVMPATERLLRRLYRWMKR
jgi:hypothetical protein